MNGETWRIFEYYWLNESRRGVPLCMALTRLVLEKTDPGLLPLPSESTFRRRIKNIPRPIASYFRHAQ